MPQLFTRALQSSAEEGDGHEGKEKTVRGGKKDEEEMDLSFFSLPRMRAGMAFLRKLSSGTPVNLLHFLYK